MRLYKGFVNKDEAKEFCKEHNGELSYEKSETEKRAKSPCYIRDCRKYYGLDEKYKYVVIYRI